MLEVNAFAVFLMIIRSESYPKLFCTRSLVNDPSTYVSLSLFFFFLGNIYQISFIAISFEIGTSKVPDFLFVSFIQTYILVHWLARYSTYNIVNIVNPVFCSLPLPQRKIWRLSEMTCPFIMNYIYIMFWLISIMFFFSKFEKSNRIYTWANDICGSLKNRGTGGAVFTWLANSSAVDLILYIFKSCTEWSVRLTKSENIGRIKFRLFCRIAEDLEINTKR